MLCGTGSLFFIKIFAPFIVIRAWGLKTQLAWSNSTSALEAASLASGLTAEGLRRKTMTFLTPLVAGSTTSFSDGIDDPAAQTLGSLLAFPFSTRIFVSGGLLLNVI